MMRMMAAATLAVFLSGCSGPFFYHDVIVPTYGQVDPAAAPVSPNQATVPHAP